VTLSVKLPGHEHLSIDLQGITVIYGHSGAGKTSLLRALAGLDHYSDAEISFRNQIWQKGKVFIPVHQRSVGYVFQDSRLFPYLTVRENLQFAIQRIGLRTELISLAEVVSSIGLTSLLSQRVFRLSGGERQRVALARTLLSAPQLLLMDEPFSALDELSKQQLLYFLKSFQQRVKIPILYVTHSRLELEFLASRLLFLEQGRVVAEGSVFDLISRLDLSLAHEQDAASVIQTQVREHDANYQLSILDIGAQSLWVSRIEADPGQVVRVRLPARDISISRSRPSASSILNILQTTIIQVEISHSARVLVKLEVEHQFFLARITRKSLDTLDLAVGEVVYAQIKSVGLMADLEKRAL